MLPFYRMVNYETLISKDKALNKLSIFCLKNLGHILHQQNYLKNTCTHRHGHTPAGRELESEKLSYTNTTRISIDNPENLGKEPVGLKHEAGGRRAIKKRKIDPQNEIKALQVSGSLYSVTPTQEVPPFFAPSGTILYTL